jgi:serine protease inhibitor ecotin
MTTTELLLNKALEETRKDLIERYTALALEQLQKMREELSKAGMDLEKVAPYPNASKMRRVQYRAALRKRQYFSRFFKTGDSYRMNGPHIVAEIPDAENRLRAETKIAADAQVDSYINKLAGKIGKQAASVRVNGRVWDGAVMEVVCEDGEAQSWRTKCIINRSVYGKFFNQWPTRR